MQGGIFMSGTVNEAIKRVDTTNADELNRITGQVNLPNIPGLM